MTQKILIINLKPYLYTIAHFIQNNAVRCASKNMKNKITNNNNNIKKHSREEETNKIKGIKLIANE